MTLRLLFQCPMFKLKLKSFPKQQILDSSKLKEFVNDNFRFDINGKKFSKWVENNLGKGESARYEQFLLFLAMFSKGLYCRHIKTRVVWERVKMPQPSMVGALKQELAANQR